MASYALQLPYTVPLTYLGIFGAGALIMRGAGCTINDLWDRRLDQAVGTFLNEYRLGEPNTDTTERLARTRERPLARGDVTPSRAVAFLGVQLAAGFGVLLQFNWYR